jgi:predicted component of type VI protein secretion system
MKLSLVATQGKAQGKAVPITLSQFIIGRDPQCHLRPASPLISKRHCAVLVRGGKVFARDFDSTNGTWVNDEPLKGERELHNDDRLKVGPLIFLVRIEAGQPAPKPAPAKAPAAAAPPAKAPAAAAPPARAPVPDDDESAAAMLLDAEGDPVPPDQAAAAGESIPQGSTIFEMPAVPDPNAPPDPAAAKKQPPPKPPAPASTSAAAKAILDKYTRRPRS